MLTTPLPVCAARDLAAVPDERRWLIEGLWGADAVGIVGGEPKCCKSFLALDMCVSVASGAPCLGQFPPAQVGRVLLYAAEDALPVVRRRLERIALSAGATFADLDIQVITAPTLRLDLADDRERLKETVRALSPKLLVLDPFVRLHNVDENASGEVARLLGYLRALQRTFNLSVVVVHHARKDNGKGRAGQALRGSSEFHAWGDSNLYLRRAGDDLTLTIEHRAAASSGGLAVALVEDGERLALRAIDPEATLAAQRRRAVERAPTERVKRALAVSTAPLSLRALRRACRIRNKTASEAVAVLVSEGRVRRTPTGYLLVRR
jgi:hypothetical protein